MENTHEEALRWIDGQRETLSRWVADWAGINTHSHHIGGLDRMRVELEAVLAPLQAAIQTVPLGSYQALMLDGRFEEHPLGKMLWAAKRPRQHPRVLLGIHMDTVYSTDHPFQAVCRKDDNHLYGPGVLDAKGGLAIMIKALEAFERSRYASRLGWDLFINPDEEIGSPGSGPILKKAAPQYDLALLFEPALAQGALVSERRGSGNVAFLVQGQAAHAGRDPSRGRSAILALAELILELSRLHDPKTGILVNVGRIYGGQADNMVPDSAIAHCNIRVGTLETQAYVESELNRLVAHWNERDGIHVQLRSAVFKPPKPLGTETRQLLEYFVDCGRREGLSLTWAPSAGASDGNTLAAAGLPTVDSLGGRGEGIHSPQECLEIDSLIERARLVTLFLMRLAAGELRWPGRGSHYESTDR